MEKTIKFKNPKVIDTGSLVEIVKSNSFQELLEQSFQLSAKGIESIFFVGKFFGQKEGFISNLIVGKKSRVRVGSIGDRLYNKDKMSYDAYPVFVVHGHPSKNYTCPSNADLVSCLADFKDYAKRDFWLVQPILWVLRQGKSRENLLLQDRKNIISSDSYSSIPLRKIWPGKSGYEDFFLDDVMEELDTKIGKNIRFKTLNGTKAASLFNRAGILSAFFKNSEMKKLDKILKPFSSIERYQIHEVRCSDYMGDGFGQGV